MALETQVNQELVGTFFDEVINAHNADRAPELLSETVVDHNKIVLTEPEGAGAAEEGLRMLFTAFPDLYANVSQVVNDGDCVAVRFELSGTNWPASRLGGDRHLSDRGRQDRRDLGNRRPIGNVDPAGTAARPWLIRRAQSRRRLNFYIGDVGDLQALAAQTEAGHGDRCLLPLFDELRTQTRLSLSPAPRSARSRCP
jgi:predicted SnoaL-like aldol condensation-catalyzing enzyme